MGASSKNTAPFIDQALIKLEGDSSVGIPSSTVMISEIGFDLDVFDPEDQKEELEKFREKLADAFEVAWGDRPEVLFDTEVVF